MAALRSPRMQAGIPRSTDLLDSASAHQLIGVLGFQHSSAENLGLAVVKTPGGTRASGLQLDGFLAAMARRQAVHDVSDGAIVCGSGSADLPMHPESGSPPPATDRPMQLQLLKDLATPPDLAEAVKAAKRRLWFWNRRAKVRVEEDLKLQYYYGGADVAALATPDGYAIAAAGSPEQVQAVLETLTAEERHAITILCPAIWEVGPAPSGVA